MTPPYLDRMIPRMTENVMELVELWALCSERMLADPEGGHAFSAMDDLRLVTIDIITSVTFGTSFGSTKSAVDLLTSDRQAGTSTRPPAPELSCVLQDFFDAMGEVMFFPFPSLLPWWVRTFNKKFRRARKILHTLLGEKLDAAKITYGTRDEQHSGVGSRKADNVLEMIVEKEKEDTLKGNDPLSRNELIDELVLYAMAGSESAYRRTFPVHSDDLLLISATATTLQWTVKFLARAPEVQRKLHRELVERLPHPGERTMTYKELSDTNLLPYLSAVVYEALRVSGTANVVNRDATCDTVVLGHHIPKGTQVFFTIVHTQIYESENHRAIADGLEGVRSESSRKGGRKEGYWSADDCAVFRPERWIMPDGSFNANAGPWFPFSLGFRSCFGQRFAVIKKIILFDVHVADDFFRCWSCVCSWLSYR
jgi:cytochrome P450